MRLVVVSDCHLGAADDGSIEAFVRFVDALENARLAVLGDLLHYGWSFRAGPQPGMEAVWAALERAVARGVGLVYVAGNHDFAVRADVERVGGGFGGERVEVVGGKRVHLSHGDEVDRSPGYRALSGILRSRPFDHLVQRLGPVRGSRLLAALAGTSRAYPGGQDLTTRQRDRARALLGPAADVVVMGHTHQRELTPLGQGTFVNLGGWGEERMVLVIDEDGVRFVPC